MTAKIAYIVNASGWTLEEQELGLRSVLERFQDKGGVEVYHVDHPLDEALLDRFALKQHPLDQANADGVVAVVVQSQSDQPPLLSGAARTYSVDTRGVIRPLDGVLDEAVYPYVDTHLFNRFARHAHETFSYFPYCTQANLTGSGPIDAFGNRIDFDYRDLEGRGSDCVAIAILGGSAAYSVDCLHADAWWSRLEALLNARLKAKGSGKTVRCVNFSQVGLTVMEQSIRYLMFCHRIQPEIVIAHDGWNDFAQGMVNDPYLLAKHEICYRTTHEEWAKKLHDSEVPTYGEASPSLQPRNLPQPVVAAYMSRKLMLKRVVEGNGGAFLWALQPALFSKSRPSPKETERLGSKASRNNPRFAHIFEQRLPFVYELASAEMARCLDFPYLNLHQEFSRFGERDTLFYDRVHTEPNGEKQIAEIYSGFIENNFSHLIN